MDTTTKWKARCQSTFASDTQGKRDTASESIQWFFFFFFESDNLLFHPLSCIQSRAADTLETPTILWTPQGPTEGPRWSLLKVIILQRGSGGRYEEDISAFFFSRLCCWNMPKSWNIYDLNKPNEQIIYWWGVKLTGYFNVWKKYERNGATFWELCLFL